MLCRYELLPNDLLFVEIIFLDLIQEIGSHFMSGVSVVMARVVANAYDLYDILSQMSNTLRVKAGVAKERLWDTNTLNENILFLSNAHWILNIVCS